MIDSEIRGRQVQIRSNLREVNVIFSNNNNATRRLHIFDPTRVDKAQNPSALGQFLFIK